ncbi:MAG: dienelactone hydrolase family protein, partial [Candidatus Hydrogenedentes bacterium]|nr:dienelactone hydrolase family protein [Candidatus Hydrogenedentota bacterium]
GEEEGQVMNSKGGSKDTKQAVKIATMFTCGRFLAHGLLRAPMLMSVVLLTAVAARADESAAPDPAKAGPYPVGVTTMQFTDHDRIDTLTKKPRSLLTEIWYPATDDSKDLPKNRFLDFFLRGTDAALPILMQVAFNFDVKQLEETFHNFAVRDARIRDGSFPLVLFSHGNGGLRFQNAFLCEHLASHGYIVAAPDHTGNAAVTYVDGQMVAFNEADREQAAKDRPVDIRFLIDTFQRLSSGADSRFLARIDMNRVAVCGHSFGGYTSTWLADTEPRVRAIIPMAGVAKERTNFTCPAMIMLATEDKTMKLEGNDRIRKYYDDSKGPRYFVEFKNAKEGIGTCKRIAAGEPVTYTPMDVMFPLINGYATAFLGKYLKGLDSYDAYLKENRNPAELIVKAEPTPAP